MILFDHAPDAIVLSPFIKAGSTSDKPYNHYSLVKTIEDRIGLGEHLGHAADKDVHAFGKDVFDTDSPPGSGRDSGRTREEAQMSASNIVDRLRVSRRPESAPAETPSRIRSSRSAAGAWRTNSRRCSGTSAG